MKRIVVDLPDGTFTKLKHLKESDGFPHASWDEWLKWKAREMPVGKTESPTHDLLKLWCSNFAYNLKHILEDDSISALVPDNPNILPKGPAVVIGAGPSIRRHNHLEMLAQAIASKQYQGIVCASDSMLVSCLKKDIVPDVVATVDGAEIITKFYSHKLVREHGTQIKTCLVNSANPKVVRICKRNKMPIFWFNGMMDDVRYSESWTRLQSYMTRSRKNPDGVPAVSCGGNVGNTLWALTHSLLRRSPIALIGIDLGYPEGEPWEKTGYYSIWLRLAGENIDAVCGQYKKFYNPYFKTYAFADKVFVNYRRTWLMLARRTPPWVKTINCTEGGTLWGRGITCMRFKDFLEKCKA